MVITIASYKGGVGKTTTAVHLAAYLQQYADTVLVDGDPNRSASAWHKNGNLPFRVIDERQAARFARNYQHVVIDTEARPEKHDLQALVEGCDHLIIPTTPDALSLNALMQTIHTLRSFEATHYTVLITMIPPKPSHDGEEALLMLQNAHIPVFTTGIRRAVAFQKAALSGIPVYDVADPRAESAWNDYCAIGKVLYEQISNR